MNNFSFDDFFPNGPGEDFSSSIAPETKKEAITQAVMSQTAFILSHVICSLLVKKNIIKHTEVEYLMDNFKEIFKDAFDQGEN